MLAQTEPLRGGTECILSLQLASASGPMNIMTIHATIVCSSAEMKDYTVESG